MKIMKKITNYEVEYQFVKKNGIFSGYAMNKTVFFSKNITNSYEMTYVYGFPHFTGIA